VGCPPHLPSTGWRDAACSSRDDAACSGIAQSSDRCGDRDLAQGRVFSAAVYAAIGSRAAYRRLGVPGGAACGGVRRQPAHRLGSRCGTDLAFGSSGVDGDPVLELRRCPQSRRRSRDDPGKRFTSSETDPPPTPPFQGGELEGWSATGRRYSLLPPSLKGRGRGWVGVRITQRRQQSAPSNLKAESPQPQHPKAPQRQRTPPAP